MNHWTAGQPQYSEGVISWPVKVRQRGVHRARGVEENGKRRHRVGGIWEGEGRCFRSTSTHVCACVRVRFQGCLLADFSTRRGHTGLDSLLSERETRGGRERTGGQQTNKAQF